MFMNSVLVRVTIAPKRYCDYGDSYNRKYLIEMT